MRRNYDPDKCTIFDKLGMLIGPEAGLGVYILLSTYLLYYYTNVIGLSVGIVGSLILIAKVFDGITDIIFGLILDRTRSKLGACRAWTLRICLPYAIVTVLLFTVPEGSGAWPYVYVFLVYILMVSVCYTVGDLSENTLPTYITRNQKHRSTLYMCKGLGAAVTAFVVANYTMVWVGMLGGDKAAWVKLAGIIALVGLATKLIMFFFTTERVDIDKITGGARVSVKQAFAALAKNKYWLFSTLILCMGSCIQAGTASTASYYAQYVLGDIRLVGPVLSAFLIPPFFGFILSGVLMQKLNRKTIVIAAVAIGLVGSTLSLIGGSSSRFLLLFGLGCRGLAYSMIIVTVNAMAADTVEYGHWKTGVRTQGVLMSGKGLGDKISVGVLTAIVGWVMAAGGFNGTMAVQPASAIAAISGLFLYTPFVLFALSAVFVSFYHLDKEYPAIMRELAEREAKLGEVS
jgi:glycoside/pentoside/hexuronide:cation symporter, GPH family